MRVRNKSILPQWRLFMALFVTIAVFSMNLWTTLFMAGMRSGTGSIHNEHSTAAEPSIPTNGGLLNHHTIRSRLLAEAPWAESHGSDHGTYLGAAMLYYSFAYAFQCQTIVVLGSGGGFVPRVLRQAQRDLESAGIVHQNGGPYQLILVDAHLASAGFGSTFYAENKDTVMRKHFKDIRYIFQTTDNAFAILKRENVRIDYLHVDADHSAEQSWKDFENFATLLNDRSVVSFHDTCRDEKRHCRTGVPDTIDRVRRHLQQYKLQLIDAHYMYRGIAFAIPMDAPALERPATSPRNFCQKNAASLSKTSPGFTKNKKRGSLPSLGDYYDCNTRFDMASLGAPCPFGSRRDKKGKCTRCIPGMEGKDCKTFRYSQYRSRKWPDFLTSSTDMRNRQRLVAAWLADRKSQHIFEYGISIQAASEYLLLQNSNNNIKSVVVADPRIEEPVWTDDGHVPSVRWIPCPPQDVLDGGRYSSHVGSLQRVDAIVCWQCDEQIYRNPFGFASMVQKEFPNAVTLVIEGSSLATALYEKVTKELAPASWRVETKVTLGTGDQDQTDATPRRIILLTRSQNAETLTQQHAPPITIPDDSKGRSTSPWTRSALTFSDFHVAGVNLAAYGFEETKNVDRPNHKPFELFEDFDLSSQITGNESWKDLLRYRRDAKHESLSFYVDKVARKRWLPTVGLSSPKAFLLKYASELTATGRIKDEEKILLQSLPKVNDYAAKPTHLSCSGGVFLVKRDDDDTVFISHGSKKFKAVDNFQFQQIAKSLAKDLHEGPRCGSQLESRALENVKPGVMFEERFTNPFGKDDSGGMEFKVVTIWGRVWLGQWRPGVSDVRAFIQRNGTTLDWGGSNEPLPEWVDWQRIVKMAEQLGAHKDMFRTDIFVGVPAGSLRPGASRKERLSAVQYVVSETEIHPTPIKGTEEVFKEAGRLWLAGYKLGNYKIIKDTEVPPEFLSTGSFSIQSKH